jgi:fructosamine-3-kinase
LFGGFSAGFFQEYHSLIPKTDPKHEYDDRVELYMLYHQLNHCALFGGEYRGESIARMRKLCAKYPVKKGE